MRKNRNEPKKANLIRSELKKRDLAIYSENHINLLDMHDKKVCSWFSSFHNLPKNTQNSSVEKIKVEKMVKDYNKYMGGVDILTNMSIVIFQSIEAQNGNTNP